MRAAQRRMWMGWMRSFLPSWAAAWRDPHRRADGCSCCAAPVTMAAQSLPEGAVQEIIIFLLIMQKMKQTSEYNN